MRPLTFGVGPSRLSDETIQDLQKALELGIPEISHRSAQFTAISKEAVDGLRTFFAIPEDYAVFFTTSATEAIELTIRNLVRHRSAHFANGRFSELYAETATANGKTAQVISAPWGMLPKYDASLIAPGAELITITANETSTGVLCSNEDILRIRKQRPDHLLAVDITSIAGMKVFPIAAADIWLFSVQKGFGLPAGLGVLIVSPRAITRSAELERDGENRAGIFTFAAMEKIMREKYQTICTPNVFAIYALSEELKRWNAEGGCAAKEQETQAKADLVYAAVSGRSQWKCFVEKPDIRSISIACIQGEEAAIEQLHSRAKEQNMLLGKGYGKIKATTARIALFPAIGEKELQRLLEIL
ncbi:MAG: aminotransferase class V-fold PLP-dependent enzyme [Candidatus Peregrinibacteria bacterium]